MEILLSYAKNKSNILKRYVEGESVFLIYKQEILQHSLKENRISVNELMASARSQGIGDLSSVEYAILEQNGSISILEKNKIMLCMECGCCSFVCPANRPLVQNNRIAKAEYREHQATMAKLKK